MAPQIPQEGVKFCVCTGVGGTYTYTCPCLLLGEVFLSVYLSVWSQGLQESSVSVDFHRSCQGNVRSKCLSRAGLGRYLAQHPD